MDDKSDEEELRRSIKRTRPLSSHSEEEPNAASGVERPSDNASTMEGEELFSVRELLEADTRRKDRYTEIFKEMMQQDLDLQEMGPEDLIKKLLQVQVEAAINEENYRKFSDEQVASQKEAILNLRVKEVVEQDRYAKQEVIYNKHICDLKVQVAVEQHKCAEREAIHNKHIRDLKAQVAVEQHRYAELRETNKNDVEELEFQVAMEQHRCAQVRGELDAALTETGTKTRLNEQLMSGNESLKLRLLLCEEANTELMYENAEREVDAQLRQNEKDAANSSEIVRLQLDHAQAIKLTQQRCQELENELLNQRVVNEHQKESGIEREHQLETLLRTKDEEHASIEKSLNSQIGALRERLHATEIWSELQLAKTVSDKNAEIQALHAKINELEVEKAMSLR